MRAINNPKVIERNAVKTDMKIVGIALIGYLLLISLSELVIVFITGVYINGVIALGASLVGFGFIWFCFRGNFRFRRVFHQRRAIPPKVMRNAIVCVVGIIPLYQLLEALIKWVFMRWNYVVTFPDIDLDRQWWPLTMAGVVVVGPLIEEILFRGFVMRKLSRYGRNFAIFFSAALFGLYQANFVQMPEAFILGSILGYITFRYSIKWAFILHCIHNLAIFLVAMFQPGLYINYGIFGIFFVLMLITLIAKRAKLLRFFSLGRSLENAYRYSLTVPWILVFVAITIFASAIQTDVKTLQEVISAAAAV